MKAHSIMSLGFCVALAIPVWNGLPNRAVPPERQGEAPVSRGAIEEERKKVRQKLPQASRQSPAERRKQGWEMVQEAEKDLAPAHKAALLEEAADIGAQTWDIALAWHALSSRSAVPTEDAVDLFQRRLDATRRAAKRIPSDLEPGYRHRIVKALIALCDEAALLDRYPDAVQCAKEAHDFARLHLRNRPAAWLLLNDKAKEIEFLRSEADKLNRKYRDVTDDPTVNEEMGLFLCLLKGDWNTGLPYLAKGANKDLREIARQDLGNPANWQDQKTIGDFWWNYRHGALKKGGSRGDVLSRRHAEVRAALYYGRILDAADGGDRVDIEKRWVWLSRARFLSILGDAVLRLAFDGKAAYDVSGLENSGAIEGGELVPQGICGPAVRLRGDETGDRIVGKGLNGFPFGTAPRTYGIWVQTQAVQHGSGPLLGYGGRGAADGKYFGLGLLGGGEPAISGGGRRPDGRGNNHTPGGPRVNDGHWHHVTAVYEGLPTNRCRLYVDGKLALTDKGVLVDTAEETEWRIGQNGGSLRGAVCGVILLDDALTGEDVMTLYRFGKMGFGVDFNPRVFKQLLDMDWELFDKELKKKKR